MTQDRPLLVDSHCHLDFPDYGEDRGQVIRRAREAGVGTLLTISTKITEFPAINAIAESDPDIWCTFGIHPHEAEAEPETTRAQFLEAAKLPKVVAFGECGLDYYYDHSPRDRQQEVFRAHMAAAREADLPLVVHTRDADADTARMLTEESGGGRLKGVLHCFSSGRDLALHALDLGFFLSFSGMVTFKKADELRAIVADMPLDRILVETDAPFLAPVPHRGKRNEPAHVVHTARVVAELKGVSREDVARITTDNFHRLFSKAKRAGAPC